ncbi:MAG: nitrate reductase cytochrome c-type subunit [Nitrospirae bacterium]|nr:nitrate reductase cytochrome c-type subunit [Nitrospirota bacterium]MBF0533512.1 nitrate reductase cytochrome c-type subunit [Nitrospirota bacterium]MBF0615964.1 nitrate reductase cytochrome c-type subunit [Nitrospirota bacterium]
MKPKNTRAFVKLIVGFVIVLMALPVCAGQNSVSEDEMGLRKHSLFDENNVQSIEDKTVKPPPGQSTRYDRSFENSPPLIPHNIEGLNVITTEQNLCMGCHMPENAKAVNATPLPKTHLLTSDSTKLDGNTYNCVQCHVPQSDAKPLIDNEFTRTFRNKKSRTSSNLSEIRKEGIN